VLAAVSWQATTVAVVGLPKDVQVEIDVIAEAV